MLCRGYFLPCTKRDKDVTHRQPFCLCFFDYRYPVLGCADGFIRTYRARSRSASHTSSGLAPDADSSASA